MTDCYAEGGEIKDAADDKAVMEHCALECMNAIENKNKEAFLDSFHVLVADILNKLEMSEDEGEA